MTYASTHNSTHSYAHKEEEGPRKFFKRGADPLSILANLEKAGQQESFEAVLAARRIRKPDGGYETEEGAQTEEEYGFTTDGGATSEDIDDDELRPSASKKTAAKKHKEKQAGDRMDIDQDGGQQQQKQQPTQAFIDPYDQELAERMGIAPADPSNRQRMKNREKYRKRAAKSGKKTKDIIPPAATAKLGEANLAYATGQTAEAISLLLDVVKIAPNLPDPYHTLGLLHEQKGDKKKALDLYMIAAHITPRDINLWKRLATMSSDQGLIRQAVYCYTQVLRRDKDDLDSKYDRALLYAEIEDNKKAIEEFTKLQEVRPDHPEVPKALARLHYRLGNISEAIGVVRKHVEQQPEQTDLTHINILAELLAEVRDWEGVYNIIKQAEKTFLKQQQQGVQSMPVDEERRGEGGTAGSSPPPPPPPPPLPDLPVELRVKEGAALAALGRITEAQAAFAILLQQPIGDYPDLYAEAGGVLLGLGLPGEAFPFLKTLAEHPAVGGMQEWTHLAECHRDMGDFLGAAEVYRGVLETLSRDHPGYVDALVMMIDLLKEGGEARRAAEAAGLLEDVVREQGAAPPSAPEDRKQAVDFVLKRAAMLRAAGKRGLFLEVAIPVLATTLRVLERERSRSVGGHFGNRGLRRTLKKLTNRHKPGHADDDDGDDEGMPQEGGIFIGYTGDKKGRNIKRRKSKRGNKNTGAVTGGETTEEEEDEELYGDGDGLMGIDSEAEDNAIRQGEFEDGEGGKIPVIRELLKEEAPYHLLIHAIQALLQEKRSREAKELAQAAVDVCGKRWSDRSKKDVLRLLLFEAALAGHDMMDAAFHLKAACARWPYSNIVWNAHTKLQTEYGGLKAVARFVGPMRAKHYSSLPLMMASGHCSMLQGRYSEALSEYLHAYKSAPHEPVISLCIAAAMLNKACVKKMVGRHQLVIQAFAFLQEYGSKRPGKLGEMESCYNIGRGAQALGLDHLAVQFYERVIPPVAVDEGGGDEVAFIEPNTSVEREAAYNLALIYQSSGSIQLAKQLTRRYLTF